MSIYYTISEERDIALLNILDEHALTRFFKAIPKLANPLASKNTAMRLNEKKKLNFIQQILISHDVDENRFRHAINAAQGNLHDTSRATRKIFFCYNQQEKKVQTKVGLNEIDNFISVFNVAGKGQLFIDEKNLITGENFETKLQELPETSSGMLIVIGSKGEGNYQTKEIDEIAPAFHKRNKHISLIKLSSCKSDYEIEEGGENKEFRLNTLKPLLGHDLSKENIGDVVTKILKAYG